MDSKNAKEWFARAKRKYPDKFASEEKIFSHIRLGDTIFIGTGCGEPQYLVKALIDYVKTHPKAFLDAEVLQVVSLGVVPYTDEKLKKNFRLNSFFIGDNTRAAINKGLADYSPYDIIQRISTSRGLRWWFREEVKIKEERGSQWIRQEVRI